MLWIGIKGSLIAGFIYGLIALFIAAYVRRHRAKPFIGKYKMFEGETPSGGPVSVEYHWWKNLIGRTPVLKVVAKHRDGTEDWRGTIEVTGLDEIASGIYRHLGHREVGTLRFARSDSTNDITEYGTPYDPTLPQFIRILQRM